MANKIVHVPIVGTVSILMGNSHIDCWAWIWVCRILHFFNWVWE